ncbi:hypothetical protein MJN54_33830, partial [Salmonella enterica subsp. enterica serovar Kentucky]|nr:hypothetical protein [Salmonella enterica subsp. enterica serovar Kentucky]
APAAKPQAVPNAVTIAELVSPITGEVVALDQVPDEAFASKAVWFSKKLTRPIIMVTHRPAITGNFRASVRDFPFFSSMSLSVPP